jgi:hypothetical protein
MEEKLNDNFKKLSKPQELEGVFKFDTEKQRKIHEALIELDQKHGKKIVAIYEGILVTARNKNHPDRMAQASHSIRELANIIPIFKTGLPEKSKSVENIIRDENGWNSLFAWIDSPNDPIPEKAKKVIDSIKLLFKQQNTSAKIVKGLIGIHPNRSNLPDYLQEGLVKEWLKLHKWFVKTAHYNDIKNKQDEKITEKIFESNLRLFEDLLYRVLCSIPFFESVEEIDEILKIEKPSRSDAITLFRLISHSNHQRYFYERCTNPEWLDLLNKEGAFNKPQEPLKRDDYVQFIPWPQSAYLAKMAPHKPSEVFNIIKELNTENQTILGNFMDAALSSPIDIAALYPKLIISKKWIQNPYSLILPEKIGKLIEYLSKENRTNEALMLVRAVFDTKVKEPTKTSDNPNDLFQYIHHDAKAYFDDWRLGEIARENLKELIIKNPIDLFDAITAKLHQAIRLEGRIDEKDPLIDYSYIWRPNLWNSRKNNEDAKNLMIDILMDIIKNNEKDEKNLKKIIEIINKHRLAIFCRIKMALYALNPCSFQKEVENILIDQSIMTRSNMSKEYLPLLNKAYPLLSPESQKIIKDLIEQCPGIKKTKDMSESNFSSIQLRWKNLYKSYIKDYLLPEEIKDYDEYVSKHGKPLNDDGEIHEWEGGISPINREDLEVLGPDGVVKYLANYKETGDPFDRYSSGGLGSIFSGIVKNNPEEYTKQAMSLIENNVNPIYVYYFLNGFKGSNAQISESIIDMCLSVVDRTEKEGEEDTWEVVRREISGFINDYLRKTKHEMPIAFREKVWKILSSLAKDSDPSAEREEKDNFDPLSLAINSIRGETIDAAISYGLWCARQESSKEKTNKMASELEFLLNKHLDISQDSSLAIRSVYGKRLPNIFYLNSDWIKNNKSKIFSRESEKHLLAAWNGYLANGVIKEVFEILKEEYRYFIPFLDKLKNGKKWPLDISDRFSQHLMVVYCNDPNSDDIINDFFEQSKGEIRAQAINFCGRSILREISDLPGQENIKIRLAQLWDSRLSINLKETSIEELQEFGWWFKHSPFTKKETLERLTKTLNLTNGKIEVPYEIIEELIGYVDEFPLESIKILNLMARSEKESHEISYKMSEYREIIKKIKDLGDQEAIKIANEMINYLGEQGFLDGFRDLL